MPLPDNAPDAPASPDTTLQGSFDGAFPDDGLDTAPPSSAPPPEKAGTAEKGAEKSSDTDKSGVSSDGSKATDTSKGATAAAGFAKSTASGSKAADDASAGTAGDDFTLPAAMKPTELRSWASKMSQRAQKAESSLQSLRSEVEQLRSRPPQQAGDSAALASELAAAKKQIDDYESNIRLTKYERSQEYATKFQKPYQDSIARAYREVKELLVTTPNPKDPEEMVERPATEQDFNEIYNMPLGQATKTARAKFGDAATIVLNHRQNVRELAEAAFTAVEEYKTKGTEAEKAQQAQAAQQAEGMHRMFSVATEGYAKHKSDLFLEHDGDTEGNGLLSKGREFASAVFSGNDGLSPQQIVMRDAVAFNRLSAYPRLVRDVSRLQEQLKAANETIAELQKSGPGAAKGGDGKTSSGSKPSGSWEDDFEKAVV